MKNTLARRKDADNRDLKEYRIKQGGVCVAHFFIVGIALTL